MLINTTRSFVYRAIHLEFVVSLCIFFNGKPERHLEEVDKKTVYSDNGTNFRDAHNELSDLDCENIMHDANIHKFLGKFNPPTIARLEGFGK
ncbi:hypothetical protein TNCT_604321 [Trichonephila clavata]|uniref:Uncharacterized protein n=1 Tax=Trichonephila clavata TaxID=2740835 RepID=A0A8X6IBP1_TRICU|nr:hypothetical protein TNCT_604321 [Trichonephila clavata]